MMPRYDSTRDVTPKYSRRMLNVPQFHAIRRPLKADTKRYQEETQNDDEIRHAFQPTSDARLCSVIIFCIVCMCLLIVRI